MMNCRVSNVSFGESLQHYSAFNGAMPLIGGVDKKTRGGFNISFYGFRVATRSEDNHEQFNTGPRFW